MAIYYANSAADPGGDGTTTATTGANCAFNTIAAAQAALTGDQSDNSLLFNKGQTWREQFTVGANGTSGHPFTIGSYGTGDDPIITGFGVISSMSAIPSGETGGILVIDAEEGDVSEFTSTTTAGDATITADAGAKNNGTYGFKLLGDGTNVCCGTKTFTEAADIYVRFYFYVPTGTVVGATGTARSIKVLDIYDGATQLCWVTLQQPWDATYVTSASIIMQTPWVGETVFTVTLDAWNYIEVRYKGGDAETGGYQCWLNGVSKASNFVQNTGAYAADSIKAGNVALYHAGSVLADDDFFYIDDIKADTSAVGAYSGGAGGGGYQKTGVTTEPKLVAYDGTLLLENPGAATAVAEGEWDWAANVLYINVGEDPAGGTVEAAQRDYCIYADRKSYITVQDLALTGANTHSIDFVANSASLSNNTVSGCAIFNSFDGIAVLGTGVTGTILIDSNAIFDLREYGVLINTPNATGNIVQDNAIYNIGLTALPGADTNMQGIYIDDIGGIVQGNEVFNTGNTGAINDGSSEHCIYFTGANQIIRYNNCHDTTGGGIKTGGATGPQIYYNLCYANRMAGIFIDNQGSPADINIYNNVCYANGFGTYGGGGILLQNSTSDAVTIKNNILFGNTAAAAEWPYTPQEKYQIQAWGANTNFVCDNNLLYIAGATTIAYFGAAKTWAQWQALGYDVNGLNEDPVVVSTVTPDFSLQSGSPCRNAGADVSLTVDYAGNAVGLVPDIGAYEYAVVVPTLAATTAASDITTTTATSGGNVTDGGDATVTVKGVCWGTGHNPSIYDDHVGGNSGTGAYTESITGLTRATQYYVRAYATNSAGTAYGTEIDFTTLALAPTVAATTAASSITGAAASSGGNVTDDGGATVTARGVCWRTTTGPTTADSKTTDAGTTGAYTSSITGLSPNTKYYVRAYATNSVNTTYGAEINFTTDTTPTVTTSDILAIGAVAATGGGEVTDVGGDTVTVRGVCWKTSENPTTANSKTTDGSGLGEFASAITGLTPGTTYYVRAYATNAVGTSYGDNVNFTTISLGGGSYALGMGMGLS